MSRPARHRVAGLAAALTFLLIAAVAQAQTPTVFSYQGRLLSNDATQTPVDGTIDVNFSIWSGPTGDGSAVQLWSESWTGVTLSNGVFSVLLGSNGSPLDPVDFQGDTTLFLQLEIDGETLTPRQQLGAVPFAVVDEPANERQDVTLTGDSLQLTDSSAAVDLSPYLDNTDNQQLSLSGNSLQLTSDDGTDTVDLSPLDNAPQDLSLDTGTDSLSLSEDPTPVDLSGYLDDTDNQDLNSVLANGTNANNRNIANVNDFNANDISTQTLDCPGCVHTGDIAQDTVGGNDIQDNIFILHIECNGSCNDMSMREACDVIEQERGLSMHTELIGVSCVHGVPSTSGNGFVDCNDGTGTIGDNECRAFNLRTLGDIPCIDGNDTDAIVTCLLTDMPR